MSLATDILKMAADRRATKKPQPVTYPKTKKPPEKKPVRRKSPMPGISFHRASGGWEAYVRGRHGRKSLGTFGSRERAILALRLFKLWGARGFVCIPHKPEHRLYTKW